MNKLLSKSIRGVLVASVLLGGAWLIGRSSDPAAETVARYDAVQQALAPGRARGEGGETAVSPEQAPTIVQFTAVRPASVDMSSMPSRPSKVDRLQQQYLAGEIDIEANEGPVSEAVYETLLAESLAQKPDRAIQSYSVQSLASTLTAGANFKSIDYTQSQQGVPPDPDITVGHDHIIVGVNTSFQIFDKAGNSLVGPTLFEDFWGANCGTGSSVSMFDPYLDYDEKEGRYILGITAYDPNVNGGDNGYACIAVSKTDSATGQWWLYSFDGNPGTGTDYFFDYPHLGVGQNALYLSANMFGTSFVRNHVFAYDKFAMYAGQSANSVKINVGSSNFTIQPAKMHGYTSGGWPTNANEPHYFVDAQYGNNQNRLTVWKMTDPFGTASLTQAGTVTVNSYSLPVSQPQLGGSNIQGNDNRLLDVKYWGGKLYTTHAVGCNPGSGTVNCIRWYIIDISSGTPSLIDQGTFASNGEYRSFPAIAPNACGDMLVGYTKTSSSIYPSVYVAGREAADPAGQLKQETLLHAGEAFYTAYDSVPRRWGDYTGMGIDPDGVTFWYVGEYSRNQATARWSTWVGSYTWPGCNVGPTPTPGPTATATNTPLPTNTPGPSSCTIYASSDIPKAISTSGTPSVSSVLSVPAGGTITDVNVLGLNGTHTWINDLDFNLTSPQGTAVQIMAQSCNSEDNFSLSLDDEASPGSWPCPPVGGGTYQPSSPLSAFDGQNSAGTWTLRIDDNANLDGGSLNGWSLEICTEGAGPTPTNTPIPPTPTNTPVPPTPTNTPVPPTPTNTPMPPGGDELIYVSSTTNGNANGLAYNDEDIIVRNQTTGAWSLFFDGSDVGLTTSAADVDAFYLMSDGSLLLSFVGDPSITGLGTVARSDIVRFVGTFGSNTSGTFTMYFDGSDVGLTTTAENIDAMGVDGNGRLLISTTGSPSVTGLTGLVDEDVMAFTPTSLGATTAGSWSYYFDGSDVGLSTSNSEDVTGSWSDANGDLYLSALGAFSVAGASGDGADIFRCASFVSGSNTSCTFSLYWDGSANGFAGEVMDGLFIDKP